MFLKLFNIYKSHGFQLGNHGSNLTEEELETHTISAWKEGKLNLNRQIEGNSGHLIHVSASSDALRKFFNMQTNLLVVPSCVMCILCMGDLMWGVYFICNKFQMGLQKMRPEF